VPVAIDRSSHVLLNLARMSRPVEEVIEELEREVLPEFFVVSAAGRLSIDQNRVADASSKVEKVTL
jgi:hypothetical protein